MPAESDFEGFWDFSIRTYRTPGVPEVCLSLQNDYGADVNMLLYCCWAGTCVGQIDGELFARASGFSTLWADNVVTPLRFARTWMKQSGCNAEPVPRDACMELRDEIKSVEFASEKLQQEVLESLVSTESLRDTQADQVLQDVAANLEIYADFVGLDDCDDVRKKLSVIIDAAFPSDSRG